MKINTEVFSIKEQYILAQITLQNHIDRARKWNLFFIFFFTVLGRIICQFGKITNTFFDGFLLPAKSLTSSFRKAPITLFFPSNIICFPFTALLLITAKYVLINSELSEIRQIRLLMIIYCRAIPIILHSAK